MRTLSALPLQNQKVLMRVDFNVPLDEKGNITDDTRIVASLPTIQYILDQGASLVLMSHLGRPQGVDPALSLAPCRKRLEELLKRPVRLAPDCVGKEVEEWVQKMKPGEVLLLENLRFHPGEKKPEKEPEFVKSLARLGTVYVNDAFGSAHRAHASTALVASFFEEKGAGFLMEKEWRMLSQLFESPSHPFAALIGGAKISTKVGVLKSLASHVDRLLIGGAMAHTFFLSRGISVGDSLVEKEGIEAAIEVEKVCQEMDVKLALPVDVWITKEGEKAQVQEVKKGIPEGWKALDIGPKSVLLFKEELASAKTILWNGPVGAFETPPFDQGTKEIGQWIASLNAIKVVGGGDTVAAINAMGITEKMTHVSTGGGATLEFIEKGTLPGIETLANKQDNGVQLL